MISLIALTSSSRRLQIDQCYSSREGEWTWKSNAQSSIFLMPTGLQASGSADKESTCQCRRLRRYEFDPWVRKIPWRRKWQPTPIFLPGKSHGQRSLASYTPWGHKARHLPQGELMPVDEARSLHSWASHTPLEPTSSLDVYQVIYAPC